MKCGKGKIIEPVQEFPLEEGIDPTTTGTEISFMPDPEIFYSIPKEEFFFDVEYLEAHLRDLAYLNPIQIQLINNSHETPKINTYHFEGGLIDFINYMNNTKNPRSRLEIRGRQSQSMVPSLMVFCSVLRWLNNMNLLKNTPLKRFVKTKLKCSASGFPEGQPPVHGALCFLKSPERSHILHSAKMLRYGER